MPSISDEAYSNLKKLTADVSFRSGRLREWIAVGRTLRNFSALLDQFSEDARAAPQNPAVFNQPRMSDAWRNIEDNPLVEFESFRATNGLRYINRPLVSNGTESSDLTVSQWLDQLLESGALIRAALDGLKIQELANCCVKLDSQLTQILRKHRATVDLETEQLFLIATNLSNRLDV
jgi:hypothetical protein